MSWIRLIPLLVVLVVVPGPPAWAGPATDQLRMYTDQVLKILQNPSMTLAERREAVRQLAEEVFDVNETAQRALGQHWQQRTPAEREEFVKLFANLLEQTYISRIDEFGGEKLTYVSEQLDGERGVVRARITTKNGTEVPVESRVLLKGNRWLIYDLLVRGAREAPADQGGVPQREGGQDAEAGRPPALAVTIPRPFSPGRTWRVRLDLPSRPGR